MASISMLSILLHTSKTMRPIEDGHLTVSTPQYEARAEELMGYLSSLSVEQIANVMKISSKLADKVTVDIAAWTPSGIPGGRPAIDSFIGDIYSGLQVQEWSSHDREYAQGVLRILSGLYGVLRPLDTVKPYRLEMGYRLPDMPYKNLYSFWGDLVAKTIPHDGDIVNLSAVEYSKLVTPYVDVDRIITPQFLTVSPKTHEPTFVVVHAKIARGAFAAWLIRNRVADSVVLCEFTQLGYKYDASLSTPASPVFICESFGGLGLSVRLT